MALDFRCDASYQKSFQKGSQSCRMVSAQRMVPPETFCVANQKCSVTSSVVSALSIRGCLTACAHDTHMTKQQNQQHVNATCSFLSVTIGPGSKLYLVQIVLITESLGFV